MSKVQGEGEGKEVERRRRSQHQQSRASRAGFSIFNIRPNYVSYLLFFTFFPSDHVSVASHFLDLGLACDSTPSPSSRVTQHPLAIGMICLLLLL